jgi:signal transduction histidine kinase
MAVTAAAATPAATELEDLIAVRALGPKPSRKRRSQNGEGKQAAVDARADERRRISRLLHDDVGQCLTALSVKIAILKTKNKSPALRKELASLDKLVQRTSEAVQKISRSTHPHALDDLGLLAALRSHIRTFSNKSSTRVELVADKRLEKTGQSLQLSLFRCVEALLNDVDVTGAPNTRIQLAVENDSVDLTANVQFSGEGRGAAAVADWVPQSFQQQILNAEGTSRLRIHGDKAMIRAELPLRNDESL